MAGTPDVLTSPPTSPWRRWFVLALVVAAVAAVVIVGLIDGGARAPQAGAPAATSSAAGTPRAPATSTTIDPADRITGSLPAAGSVPSGAIAVEAAQGVADSYCPRIASWRLTVDGEDGEYLRVVVLLRPNGPAYRNVALRIELTWDTDHYDWAGSRTALESCP